MKSSWLDGKKVRLGPTLILLYLLGVGAIEMLLRLGILGADHFSLPLLYVNTMLFSLFFGIVLTILSFVVPEKGTSDLIKDICGYFWILGLTPLFSYYAQGEILDLMVSAPPISVLFLILIFSFILGLKMVSKVGMSKSIITSAILVGASFPIFMLDQVYWASEIHPYFRVHLLIVILLIENLVVYSIFAYKFFPKNFTNLLKSIKPFRTLHFMMMVILGVIFVREIAPDEALSFTNIQHIPFIFLPVFCLVLIWQFTTLLNDLYDVEIDVHVHPDRPLAREDFDRERYVDILISTVVLTSLFSFLIGIPLMLLNFAAIFLAVSYSVPPFRFRDRLYGHICVGLGSLIGFLFGVYSPIYWIDGIYRYTPRLSSDVPFFTEVFTVSMLIVIVLSISPLINALSDYEGDKRSGVRNVYTVLGFKKGKKIVSVLIVFLFISPMLLFRSPFDLIFMLSAGLVSSAIFYRLEDHRPVFGMYFLVLVYLMLRFIKFF